MEHRHNAAQKSRKNTLKNVLASTLGKALGNALAAACVLLPAIAFAADDLEGLEALPDVPPPPPPIVSGQPMDLDSQQGRPGDSDLEPEIRIIRRTEDTVEEYRFNGKLYMVKITPKFGPSYFLRDTDGDGKMETRLSSIYSDMVVPQWVLFSWD